MRKLILLFLVAGLAGTTQAATITPDLAIKLGSSRADELIPVMVSMKTQADPEDLQALSRGLDKRATREVVVLYLKNLAQTSQRNVLNYLQSSSVKGQVQEVSSLFLVNLIGLKATPAVIQRLAGFPEVGEITYDPQRYLLDDVGSGPIAPGPKAGIDETDEIAWGVSDVHAPEVWAQGFNGTGVLVGMIDTGVNYNHLDLADHMWNGGPQYPHHGWDFVNNDNDPIDDNTGTGHGTHTAGTVASDGTAGSQCGVAPNATIMAIKVLNASGSGSNTQVLNGMNFAVDQGCDVYSMSLGISGGGAVSDKATYRTAGNNALAAGVIAAIAAGNEGQQQGTYPIPNNVGTPGNTPPPWHAPAQTLTGGQSNVVGVGATDSGHNIAGFSSRGPVTWSNVPPWSDYAYNPGMGLLKPDVSAPGVNIKSCSYNSNTGYHNLDGTSMATPHVAGTIALILSKNPSLTPREVDSLLETTAQDLGSAGKDNTFGAGLINALGAVNAAPSVPGSFLTISNKVIDDIGGNNNGIPDPGETCSMTVTLFNVGQATANNVVGTLSTTNTYVTITQNSATYPNLQHLQQGQGSPAYQFNVSQNCPQGEAVSCSLHVTADGGYSTMLSIEFLVGDPLNAPTGPDAYGYTAYDPYDAPELPLYDWVEISADSGGPGSQVPFVQDDQVFAYDLPFSFVYYGQNYTRYSIATNGWIGMGEGEAEDFSNSGIPDPDGPANMIAAYWEDLSPQRTNSGKVWRWFDQANHRLIVEYNHIEQWSPIGNFETFEVILFDPAHYPTTTGDGRIKVQYKDMSAASQSEGTVGIENQPETIGIQYFFDGALDMTAHPITNHFAILYTTPSAVSAPQLDVTLTPINPPIVIPANGGTFSFYAGVINHGPAQNYTIWARIKFPDGTYSSYTMGPVILNTPVDTLDQVSRDQNVPSTWPAGTYTYVGYGASSVTYPAIDSTTFTFTKTATADGGPLVTDARCWGPAFRYEVASFAEEKIPVATDFRVIGATPNPFNPVTSISYQLAADSRVNLRVYDITGRLVTTLVDGTQRAGQHSITFDGSKLASGIYLYSLTAGQNHATGKMVLLK